MLGDIRKLVNDAWEFFSPPIIRLSACAAIFWYLCGTAPLIRVLSAMSRGALFLNSPGIGQFLDKYKLTALAPVIGLFLISLLAYSINRLISGVSSLLPFNVTSTPGEITNSLIFGDPRWRRILADHGTYNPHTIIDYLIAKARYEKRESLLASMESWQNSASHAAGTFFFAKFLLAWAFASAVLSIALYDAIDFSYARVVLVVLFVISFGLYAACDYAYASRQLGFARIHVARVMLEASPEYRVNESKDAVQAAANSLNQYYEKESQRREARWWSIRANFTDRWEMLRYYDLRPRGYPRPGRLWLQAILQNSINIIWFIVAAILTRLVARMSWWAAAALFVGILTVTVLESLTVLITTAATFIRAGIARLKRVLPADWVEMMPAEFWGKFEVDSQEQFWLTAGAASLVEVLVAIVLTRGLGHFLF